jgi:predicted TIM-barrel fold metal-dependent hydrolase
MTAYVDYWCNLFTPDGLRRLYTEPPEFAAVAKWWSLGTRLQGHSVPQFVELMDKTGFGHVGIPATKVYSYAERHLIWDISIGDVAALVDRAPGRLFGMVGVNPLIGMRGVAELETAVRQHGFRAAVFHPHGFGVDLSDRIYWPFYAKCAELGIPAVVLVGHAAERMPSAPGRPLLIDDVALWFPELVIVGCSGWPWVEEMIAMAWKHPNVYYGTSQYAPRYWHPELVKFAAGRGRGKVLFGTGFPVLTHEEGVSQIDSLGLKAEAREALLSGVAHGVFGLER